MDNPSKTEKKKMKEEYRMKPKKAGVYLLRNNGNGRVFVGISTDLKDPGYRLKWELGLGKHPNHTLQKDWNTFGGDQFTIEILEDLEETDKPLDGLIADLELLKKMVIENKGWTREDMY
ncbi:MAG: GIY-YIG nuclease family protein [Deltaproteobacteria bacterium]|nr:GIY-YIG nuclease family protein [Deltaproteobacteria bacterium]